MNIEKQTNIYDYILDKHYIYDKVFTKNDFPIRLFESFAGIGCQALAFKKKNIPYVSVGISEIDKHSLKSYMAIHGETKNYGDICKMVDIPQCDVFTWSFPCTDLSKAGKKKGLSDTRSGLVYEVLRLLQATADKPRVLIMENVIDLVSVKFISEFYEILAHLEKLGYKNYVRSLNSKDFNVSQNRDRLFVVSILNGGEYQFPLKKELTSELEDILEKEVDPKYYINSHTYGKLVLEKNRYGLKVINNTDQGYLYGQPFDGIRLNQLTGGDKYGLGCRGRIQKKLAPTLLTGDSSGVIDSDYNVRYFTPLEKWRLMGIEDHDFQRAAKVCSNYQLGRQAGNGIVVDVFAEILKGLFEIDQVKNYEILN